MEDNKKKPEKVVIISCVNADFLEKVRTLAEQEGIELVQSNDKAVYDYIKASEDKGKIADILRDESKRNLAVKTARDIFTNLTQGKHISQASKYYFTKNQLVKCTNLTWREVDEVLNMLQLFGLLKRDKGRFQLLFSDKDIRREIYDDILYDATSMEIDKSRYRVAIEKSSDLSESEKKKMTEELDDIHKNIVV